MTVMSRSLAVICALAIGLLLPRAASAAEAYGEVVERTTSGSGAINWTAERVTAVGIGFPPQGMATADPARARVMADRAAYLIAVRNLLEVVKGVRVEATTVVENYMVTRDEVKAEVSGFVKGAQIIRRKANPDGSVEVEVAVPLTGIDGIQQFFQNEVKLGTASPGVEAVEDAEGHTSLIIDARGTGAKPALFPRIVDEQGAPIYTPETVDRGSVGEHGMVRYATVPLASPSANTGPAAISAVAGRKPLRIKAMPGTSTVTISLADARKVMQSPGKTADFLKKARVIILLDTQTAAIQQ